MQSQSNKYVPRLRRFEQISGAAFDQMKVDWEEDPAGTARYVDAESRIWEVYDKRLQVWV